MISFDQEPTEVLEYFQAKKPKLHFDYDEIMHEAHHKAFTVAKVTKLDLLSDIQTSLSEAFKKGSTFKEWQDNLKPTLIKKGWYGKTEVINPATGEVKEINVGSNRLKTIYETNMRTAYAQARYNSQMQSDMEYFRYSAILDQKTRPNHSKLHGLILKKDDPFWDKNYPPNGWRCRCKVRAYSKDDIKANGWSVTDKTPPDIADKDWAYNVGKTDNLQETYQQKINSLKCKEQNAKNKDVDCGFITQARNEYEKTTKYILENIALFKEIQTLYEEKDKKVELCKSDIFGKEKSIYLSSDTVQSHLDRVEISAFDYSLIPLMLEGEIRVFIQKENTYILLKRLDKYYKLALKNIKDKDEIFAVSLVKIKDIDEEAYKLRRFEEVQE